MIEKEDFIMLLFLYLVFTGSAGDYIKEVLEMTTAFSFCHHIEIL